MVKHSIYVRGVFNGLYEWGSGWKTDAHIKWVEFWKNHKHYNWQYIRIGDSEYLVSVTNSIYLHPMSFDVVLSECGVLVNNSYFDTDIASLYKIFNECAEYCGGTFSMEISQEVATEYRMVKYEKQ